MVKRALVFPIDRKPVALSFQWMPTEFEPALQCGIIFCDLVITDQATAKHSFIGSFQVYNLPSFPFAVAPFFITALVTNIPNGVDKFDVAVRIEHPTNGMVLASVASGVQFNSTPDRTESFEIVLPITNLIFQSAGNHKVVILVNNEKIGERPILVRDIRALSKQTPPQ